MHNRHGQRRDEVRFNGRSQTDAKRRALNYWYVNKARLRLNIREFSERLALLPDGKTIVFVTDR